MTFLNALLAFGATAFSVPLIIHLLNRSKYLTIDWGAMQFLDSSVKVNSRRIQWKQLLLLLIRCLIPVLLALAMARPLFSRGRIPQARPR
ncbi:MAG: BatA domain-containing protein [Pirellula sp.]